MLAGGLERSGQRNTSDPTVGPHPLLTNPPAAGGAGGIFIHTRAEQALPLSCISNETSIIQSGYSTVKTVP